LKTEGKGRLELDIEGIPFALTAIADRIDRFNADDSLAVIDYKTGAKPNEFDIRHGYAPQLWLEALIAARGGFPDVSASEIAYLGFWIISGGASGKMQNPIDCSDAAASLVETSDGLRRVLGCFFKAETPYIARPNPDVVPRYSDYLHLERVQEWIFDEDTAPHDKEPAT
jgi:ATP-dependent helicase/nuclease subunit B